MKHHNRQIIKRFRCAFCQSLWCDLTENVLGVWKITSIPRHNTCLFDACVKICQCVEQADCTTLTTTEDNVTNTSFVGVLFWGDVQFGFVNWRSGVVAPTVTSRAPTAS